MHASSRARQGTARHTHTPEARGQVHGHVLVALLEAIVLADVVQVIPADDDRALHLHLGHHTCSGTAQLSHQRLGEHPRGLPGITVAPGSNVHRSQGFLRISWPLTARSRWEIDHIVIDGSRSQPLQFCYKPNYGFFPSPSNTLPNAPHTTSSHPAPTPALQRTGTAPGPVTCISKAMWQCRQAPGGLGRPS